MFLKTTKTLLISALAVFSLHAHAYTSNVATSNEAEAAGQNGSDAFVSNLENVSDLNGLNKYVKQALNVLVGAGIDELRLSGANDVADQVQQEWNQMNSSPSSRDIGDHTPLNAWLGNFTKLLEAQVGIQRMKDTRLYDLMVFNYGIPVVFHPKGNGNEKWDIVEYGKHFVPLFSSTTYWGSLLACNYAASHYPQIQAIKPYCKKISGIAERFVTVAVAPDLSDAIYQKYQSAPVNF